MIRMSDIMGVLGFIAKDRRLRIDVMHGEHDGFSMKVWIPFSVHADIPVLHHLKAEQAVDAIRGAFDKAHRDLVAKLRYYIEEHEDDSAHDPGDEDRKR